jgi:GNAT superfamily N-acetyltransferase
MRDVTKERSTRHSVFRSLRAGGLVSEQYAWNGMERISIRVAQLSDADDIARLTTELGHNVPQSAVATRLPRILSRQDEQFLVADLDGRPVGCVHTAIAEYIEAEAFVVIGGLVVDKNHRRKGIGRRLMAEAEEWARKRGCSVVRLWSSSVRAEAHRFYQALGYTNIKTQYSGGANWRSAGWPIEAS